MTVILLFPQDNDHLFLRNPGGKYPARNAMLFCFSITLLNKILIQACQKSYIQDTGVVVILLLLLFFKQSRSTWKDGPCPFTSITILKTDY